MLNVVRRRNVKPTKPKKHLLNYEGQSLYRPTAFERFIGDYSKIYLDLFRKFA